MQISSNYIMNLFYNKNDYLERWEHVRTIEVMNVRFDLTTKQLKTLSN